MERGGQLCCPQALPCLLPPCSLPCPGNPPGLTQLAVLTTHTSISRPDLSAGQQTPASCALPLCSPLHPAVCEGTCTVPLLLAILCSSAICLSLSCCSEAAAAALGRILGLLSAGLTWDTPFPKCCTSGLGMLQLSGSAQLPPPVTCSSSGPARSPYRICLYPQTPVGPGQGGAE